MSREFSCSHYNMTSLCAAAENGRSLGFLSALTREGRSLSEVFFLKESQNGVSLLPNHGTLKVLDFK